jgi:hypothetical protein
LSPKPRAGVVASGYCCSGRIHALANALRPESGFYRPDDAGASWTRVGTQGPVVEPGRYRATLGKKAGETVQPIGAPQTFAVVLIQQ